MADRQRPSKRGRGRPALAEGEPLRKRTVLLPPDLDDAAARAKGDTPWATWLRTLVERAARGGKNESHGDDA